MIFFNKSLDFSGDFFCMFITYLKSRFMKNIRKTLMVITLLIIASSKGQEIGLEIFATGFSSPVAIENAGDDRLFVVERGGTIKILNANGTTNSTPFLSLNNSIVLSGGERGLLGLAFHPDYVNNRYFYINYTRANDGATVIARYQTNSTNPNIADPNSAFQILTVAQPYSNHNGGTIRFGTDGFLYIGMGDGGSGGDPENYAQNKNSLLGKMLRIDIDNGSPYAIPATNPFVGVNGADEIWSVGMRNPWKFSFNRLNGDLWIADVGQNMSEEINKVNAPITPGLNFGWRCYEANFLYNGSGCGSASNYFFPVNDYALDQEFCSITGGYVYTGNLYPNFQNKYFFADFCANKIGYVNENGSEITWTNAFNGNFSTFGEDLNGELYVGGLSNGIIYKIKDESLSVNSFQENGFILYPNPVKNSLTIKNTKNVNWTSITLYDSSGRKVGIYETSEESVFTKEVAEYPKGFYTLVIESSENQTYQTKIIIE